MRLTFMGTPAFAVPSLTRLLDAGHEVALVVTQPDRPAGRGKQLRTPPVKAAAEAAGLPVVQPVTIRDAAVADHIRRIRSELIAVVAFGQILPRTVLEIPPRGCVNVHASLLPKYRGAAPIPWALIRGETVTGVTIMEIVEAMDAGPILRQRQVPIAPEDNAGALEERLAVLGAETLVETLEAMECGQVRRILQEEAEATYAPKLTAEMGRLEWSQSAVGLWNLVRGLAPQPGAYTFLRGRLVRVLEARPIADVPQHPAGVIVGIRKGAGITVATGQGVLLLTTLQPEGGRIMTAEEFARGHRVEVGSVFGSSREQSAPTRPGDPHSGRTG